MADVPVSQKDEDLDNVDFKEDDQFFKEENIQTGHILSFERIEVYKCCTRKECFNKQLDQNDVCQNQSCGKDYSKDKKCGLYSYAWVRIIFGERSERFSIFQNALKQMGEALMPEFKVHDKNQIDCLLEKMMVQKCLFTFGFNASKKSEYHDFIINRITVPKLEQMRMDEAADPDEESE